MTAKPNHRLHYRPGDEGYGTWRLECLPSSDPDLHVSVSLERSWMTSEIPDLEAQGLVCRDHCWAQDWLDECGGDCIHGNDWPENGPWDVDCWADDDGMRIEYAGPPT
jgi:hypothetical protein